jgi:hypothetical protein
LSFFPSFSEQKSDPKVSQHLREEKKRFNYFAGFLALAICSFSDCTDCSLMCASRKGFAACERRERIQVLGIILDSPFI